MDKQKYSGRDGDPHLGSSARDDAADQDRVEAAFRDIPAARTVPARELA